MEATVALAVFGVGMLGLGAAFSQIVNANTISRHKQIAVLLAERKLSQFRMTDAVKWTQTTGTFEGLFYGYMWEAQFHYHSQDLGIVDVWVKVAHISGTEVWLWSQIAVPDDR